MLIHVKMFLGEADKTKSAKEEARELQLKEEACIRQRVYNIKQKLSLGLKAIGEVVSGNPVMSHEELPYLVSIQFIMNPCLILGGEERVLVLNMINEKLDNY